jgi:hypothetical protein
MISRPETYLTRNTSVRRTEKAGFIGLVYRQKLFFPRFRYCNGSLWQSVQVAPETTIAGASEVIVNRWNFKASQDIELDQLDRGKPSPADQEASCWSPLFTHAVVASFNYKLLRAQAHAVINDNK